MPNDPLDDKELSASQAQALRDKDDGPLSETLDELPPFFARGLVYLVVLSVLAFLVYAHFSRVDIYTTVPARLSPEGNVHHVQSQLDGTIVQLDVKEGDHVQEGQPLAVVESREVSAQLLALRAAERELTDAEKESREITPLKIEQLEKQVQGLEEKAAYLRKNQEALDRKIAREEESFRLQGESADLEKRKLDEAVTRLTGELQSARGTQDLYQKEYEVTARLRQTNVIPELEMLTAQRSVEQARAAVQKAQSLLREAESERQLGQKRLAAGALVHEKNLQELRDLRDQNELSLRATRGEIEQRRSECRLVRLTADQRLEAAAFKHQQAEQSVRLTLHGLPPNALTSGSSLTTNRSVVTAPCAGCIGQLLVQHAGESVVHGQPLLTVVPDGAPLVVELVIPNKDVGLVRIGMTTRLKVDAFPYAEHGVLTGELVNVLPDVDPPPRDGARTLPGYRGYATLDRTWFLVEGKQVSLRSGMTGTAEIVTEQKSLLEILLKPFREMGK